MECVRTYSRYATRVYVLRAAASLQVIVFNAKNCILCADVWCYFVTVRIWETANFEKNTCLMGKGYENKDIGNESWFISPLLFSDYLDSLSLRFDYAYQRVLNKNDRLRVLISVDCGAHFDYVLFDKKLFS